MEGLVSHAPPISNARSIILTHVPFEWCALLLIMIKAPWFHLAFIFPLSLETFHWPWAQVSIEFSCFHINDLSGTDYFGLALVEYSVIRYNSSHLLNPLRLSLSRKIGSSIINDVGVASHITGLHWSILPPPESQSDWAAEGYKLIVLPSRCFTRNSFNRAGSESFANLTRPEHNLIHHSHGMLPHTFGIPNPCLRSIYHLWFPTI